MATILETPDVLAFQRCVRPLLEIVLRDRTKAVLQFEPDPDLQKRVEELADKSTEGHLTENERAEYAGYVRANNFLAILRRQARRLAPALDD